MGDEAREIGRDWVTRALQVVLRSLMIFLRWKVSDRLLLLGHSYWVTE